VAKIVGILSGPVKTSPPLDVVIVNHNGGELLSQCLQHLGRLPDWQVTVVDNASSDDSIQAVDSVQCQLICNNDNVGFARACNQGAAAGQAPYLAFVNPDCFIEQAALQSLVNQLDQTPEAAVMGCRVLHADGSFQAASFRRLPTFWRVLVHVFKLDRLPGISGINLPDPGLTPAVRTVPAINGACVIMRRDVFTQLDGFDESYPLHFEDLDLFARVAQAGYAILYQAQVQAIHVKGQSGQLSGQVKQWKKQGLLRFMTKHRPAWEAWLMRLLVRPK